MYTRSFWPGSSRLCGTMAQWTHKAERCVEDGRLVYYLRPADVSFWEQHWREHFSPDVYLRAEKGALGLLEDPLTRWLPKQGRILEAGCGIGQFVLALRARGYDAEGVEWAAETVEKVRSARPDLPVRVGDVRSLEVPDGHYAAYVSLGVVEHQRDGPEPILREAWRVLDRGGIALISVPWFNPLRRLKARLGFYRGRREGLEFYQFALRKEELTRILASVGFRIVDLTGYSCMKGLRDEVPLLRWMLGMQHVGPRLDECMRVSLRHFPPVAQRVAHMLLVVARKPA